MLLVSRILKDYRIIGTPPPRVVVCCVVVGCVNVASRAVVVLVVVGSDEHEAKLSIAEGSVQMPHTDVFVRTFFPLGVKYL